MSMENFQAVAVVSGESRRVWFQALGETEARQICRHLNLGFEGRGSAPESKSLSPVALDTKAAQQALGGVSRATVYRMLHRGEITRLPGCRRLLITRASIERLAR